MIIEPHWIQYLLTLYLVLQVGYPLLALLIVGLEGA